MFLRSLVKLDNSISFRNLAPNSGEDKKKVFAAFWFYLSPEFRISCCQVGITCQKTDGARHVLPPSASDQSRRLCADYHKIVTLMHFVKDVFIYFASSVSLRLRSLKILYDYQMTDAAG